MTTEGRSLTWRRSREMTEETLQESSNTKIYPYVDGGIKQRRSSYPDSTQRAQGSFGLHTGNLAFASLSPHSTQSTTHILSPEYSVATALNPIQTSSTTATIQIWMSAQSRIAPLRNDILANRLNIKRQRHQCYQQEQRLEGEMDAFIALVNSITTQDSYKQLQDSLNQHLSSIKALRYGVKILRETTAANEDTLSSQEYQLSRLEEEIYHEMDRSLQNDNFQPLSCFRSASDYTAQPSHTEVDKNPDLLEKLYTRMGEMRIYMERLSNFEYDLRQEMDERDMIRAGGQIEISDDLQFFEEARERRAQIQKDLDEAEADVDNLRHQCRVEGIAFEEPQLPNVFYHSGTESFTAPSYGIPSYHEHPIPPSGIIGAFFGAQERVKRWIRDPQPDTVEPESCSRSDTWINIGPSRSSSRRRPSSSRSLKEYHSTQTWPEWTSGPPPGSKDIEALLRESLG